MWEPRRLTNLWASMVCYRDLFLRNQLLWPNWVRWSREWESKLFVKAKFYFCLCFGIQQGVQRYIPIITKFKLMNDLNQKKILFTNRWYCHVYGWLKTGFVLVIGLINHLQIVSTMNYYTIADLHSVQSLHNNLLSLFQLVFTIRFLATDFTQEL
jgi:hypothetical protein